MEGGSGRLLAGAATGKYIYIYIQQGINPESRIAILMLYTTQCSDATTAAAAAHGELLSHEDGVVEESGNSNRNSVDKSIC